MAKSSPDIETLFQKAKEPSYGESLSAIEALARRSLPAKWWPELRDLMRSKKLGLAGPRYAIVAVGKLKEPPPEAMDELIAAASPGYQGEVPQYFSEAAVALVRIDPQDERLPQVFAHALTIDNYQLQKSAVEGLMKVNSEQCRAVLATIRDYLPRDYTEQLMIKLLNRVDDFLADTESAEL